MKIGLLGTGFGVAHAGIYRRHPAVDEVIVFGRTQAKLEKIAAEFGFATTTELDAIYDDPSIELVDVCLPTQLHADHVVRGLDAGKHVLCELPLAATSPTPSASSTPTPPATSTCLWTCSDASIPAPSCCTPQSPTSATGYSRRWRASFGRR